MELQEMLTALEEYYEAAGHTDIREKLLNNLTESQVREMYQITFNNPDDSEPNIFELMEMAANGDVEAQYKAAMYIDRESNRQADMALVAELLVRSAAAGYQPAIDALEAKGMDTSNLGKDEEELARELAEAAAAGDAEAQYQYALTFMESSEDCWMKDFDQAMEWMAKAADNGHEMAAGQLRFWTYVNGLRTKGILAKDADWMEIMETVIRLAESGDKEAQAVL